MTTGLSRLSLPAILIISILISLAGFITDIKHTQKYGGVDLRNRIVGARVMTELKQDPYYFKWEEGQNDRYLDPSDNATIPVSRVTVTPAVLTLHSVFSSLGYKTQQWLWLFIQWGALLGTIFLLTKLTKTSEQKIAIWILGLLGISGSMFWRLHVERGQMYIIYTFLFCLSLYLFNRHQERPKTKKTSWPLAASALILGLLVSLRPTFLFALIPFILYKKIRFVTMAMAGLIGSVIISSLLAAVPIWKIYYKSIQLQGVLRADETINFVAMGPSYAEGIELVNFLGVPGEDSSVQRIVRAVFDYWLNGTELIMILAAILILLSGLILKLKPPFLLPISLFFIAISLSLFAEFFIPAQRWPYANVIWIIPLALMIAHSALNERHSTLQLVSYFFALLGIITNLGFHLIPHLTFVGDLAIPLAVLLFMTSILTNKTIPEINPSLHQERRV